MSPAETGFYVMKAVMIFTILVPAQLDSSVLPADGEKEGSNESVQEYQPLEEGESEQKNYTVCDTAACQRRAQMINDSLNHSANPCVDFYSYACGGWEEKNYIPEHRTSFGLIEHLSDTVRESLKNILGSMTSVENVQRVTDKLAIAYNACVAFPTAADQPDDLIAVLNSSGLAGWPTTKGTTTTEGLNSVTEVLLRTGLHPVLEFYVGRGLEASNSHVIQMDQISFPMFTRDELLKIDNETFPAYCNVYKLIFQAALNSINQKIIDSDLNEITESVLSFEMKLARLTTDPELRRDVSEVYRKSSIKDLQENFTSFPLFEFLQKEFSVANVTLTSEEEIELYASEYYEEMVAYLKEVNPVVLFNYAGLRVTFLYAAHASKSLRNATGLDNSGYGRDTECISLLKQAMPEVLGYIYVQNEFSPEDKEEVEELAEKIIQAFNKTLQSSDWMDEQTKLAAGEKLNLMTTLIGYPNWLTNTTYLEQLYKHVPDFPPNSSFLTIWHLVSQNNWIRHLQKLREEYNSDLDLIASPADVNAFYSPNANMMVLPSGILQGLFYERDLPWSLKLGSIGTVIGHELTHGFDQQGGQFNADGQLYEWWSNYTKNKYEEKEECYSKQYLNSGGALNENMADSVGLRVAFEAYKEMLEEECDNLDTRLKNLEQFSGKHLFFLGSGMIWCGLERDSAHQNDIENSRYSLNKHRVNKPLENFKEFSTTFGCADNDPMNPSEKCLLW